MTLQDAKPRSLALRATNGWSISEGMPERRPRLEKLLAALRSWSRRHRGQPDVPAYLRADLGLPPVTEMTWEDRRMYDLILLGVATKG